VIGSSTLNFFCDNYRTCGKFLPKKFSRSIRIRWEGEVKEIALTSIGKAWGIAGRKRM
jgi:hypothetical protein